MKRVLILGGTSDASELAAKAADLPNVEVITSLAGRTRQPIALSGQVRIGGFGGTVGLEAYLKAQQIDLLIDATHPFAAQISWNAAAAAKSCQIPHLLLLRPQWHPEAGDRWIEVESNQAAAARLPDLAKRVFLTIGRQELAAYAHLPLWFLMRMIDPPQPPLPPGEILLERGPFSLEHERSLLQNYDMEAVVSKNSGGDATHAKIVAARELKLPVVMIQRPPMPETDRIDNVTDAVKWLSKFC